MGIEKVRVERALARLIPPEVSELGRVLRGAGFRAWAVGGAVRDGILTTFYGRPALSGDWDLATDARPDQVKPLFRRVIPTGIAHGTVTVLLDGKPFELTTLRGEKGHTDGRRPDHVYFVSEIEEDLARRDFTVNAIAFDLETHTIRDPFDGLGDIERRVIVAVGDPAARYQEDGLRPLRAARFAAQLEMSIEDATLRAMRPCLDRFAQVSAERVQAEWYKALKARAPSLCFRVLLDEGLLHVTCPELLPSARSEELAPLWRRLDRAAAEPVRRMAHLFAHDFGADTSEKLTNALARLRLSNQDKTRIVALVASTRWPNEPSEPDVRRWLAERGRPLAEEALVFAQESGVSEGFVSQARKELTSGAALSLPELAISGKDLLEAELVPKGPRVRALLSALLSHVLEKPNENHREQLLSVARMLAPETEGS